MREFARKNGTTLSEVRILQKQVEKEGLDDFLRDRVAAKEVRKIESVSEWYTNELISVVNRGIAQGWDEDVIKRRVESALQQSERRVKTALETIRRAASIQAVYEKASEAFNDPWMRYTGPSGANSRAFCRNYLGVVKRASEWAQIQNGQTGAVLPWVGGYNCRHRLVVARDREEFLERYFSDKNFVRLEQDDNRYYGFVVRHVKKEIKEKDLDEVEQALFDAKQGRFVRLLQEGVGGVKSFDTATDDFFTDYKTMRDAVSEKAVNKHIQSAIDKAVERNTKGVAVIWIQQTDIPIEAIKGKIRRKIEDDIEERVTRVVLRFGVNFIEREESYTRQEVLLW